MAKYFILTDKVFVDFREIMKTKGNYLIAVLLAAVMMLGAASAVFAGSLNSEEARLIAQVRGATFEYEGAKYVATSSGIAQLEATLCADDCDLTADQVDRAIALLYENVDVGIQEGLIARAGTGDSTGTDEDGKSDSRSGKSEQQQGSKSIFEEKIIGQDPVIKNTGFNLNAVPILLGLVILTVIAAGFVKGKNRIYRKLLSIGIMAMLMGLVIGISAPVLNLFQLQFEAQAIMGDPQKSFVCEDTTATYPDNGMKYGQITCRETGLDAPLYFGDTEAIFEKGAGQYSGDAADWGIPGEGKPIIVGGHDLTFFAPLENARKGQIISVKTSYGEFEYEITGTKVAEYDDSSAYTGLEGEQLVLYTCYPMGQVFGARNDRYFVYAKKVSGPVIGKVAEDE